MKTLAVSIAIAFTLGGCAAFKKTARTLNDAARVFCEVFASDNKGQLPDGMSPREWCQIQKNLDPFIDTLLSAKPGLQREMGWSRDGE
jgi:hypothetical protein